MSQKTSHKKLFPCSLEQIGYSNFKGLSGEGTEDNRKGPKSLVDQTKEKTKEKLNIEEKKLIFPRRKISHANFF